MTLDISVGMIFLWKQNFWFPTKNFAAAENTFLTKKPGFIFALTHAGTEFCTYWKFWDLYLLTDLTWHI